MDRWPGKKFDQLLQIGIGERPVCIAPLAVCLIGGAVGFLADGGLLQRHSAALTDQLPRGPQQCMKGYVKQGGQLLQGLWIWRGFSRLPAGTPPAGLHTVFPRVPPGSIRFGCVAAGSHPLSPCHHLAAIVPSPVGRGKQQVVAATPGGWISALWTDKKRGGCQRRHPLLYAIFAVSGISCKRTEVLSPPPATPCRSPPALDILGILLQLVAGQLDGAVGGPGGGEDRRKAFHGAVPDRLPHLP